MKPLAGFFWLGACLTVFAQGTVNYVNTSGTPIRTNATVFGGTAGRTAPISGSFFYALLTAPSTVTSLDQDAQNLLTPTWTFTGLYATNTTASSGGRFFGGSSVPAAGWPPGQTNTFVVVGWSADVAGADWNSVKAQLAGAKYANGRWGGISLYGSFFGVSPLGFGQAGGGTTNGSLPAFNIFGSAPYLQGNPITNGFDLFVITLELPYPFTLAAYPGYPLGWVGLAGTSTWPQIGVCLEASTDLLNWTNIASTLSDGRNRFSFTDSDAPRFPFRFYRARE